MLPTSLRLVYALNAATFQVSSLALLSIVNTRVRIPAEYLPAYGAICFLPYSLRPIFAWVSSVLLNHNSTTDGNKNRHDKLLFPVFILASLSFVGTIFIPTGGTILCFFWGFVRGIAGAWSDFLIGMAVIEFSKFHSRVLQMSPSEKNDEESYEHIVSITTAQSSTAKNIGSFASSIATFVFFAKNRNLGEAVANTLILGTAVIFVLAALVSVKYQFYVGNLSANLHMRESTSDDDDAIDNNQELEEDDSTPALATNNFSCISSSIQGNEIELSRFGDEEGTLSSELQSRSRDTAQSTIQRHQKMVEVSTLVVFQIILAATALRKPIIAVSTQATFVLLVAILVGALIFTIYIGYRYERKQKATSFMPVSDDESNKIYSQSNKLSHGRLNLYFLLRYSLPIAGFLMYSYLYTVFETEPQFLQLLSVLKSAIGSLATFFYERFLSPYFHSGWPLIGLIASLDIVMGLIALLDVWVIRAVKEKEVDGDYSIDTSLRFLVVAVGLVKYFFAELDYMPALVLSTTNVHSDDDKLFDDRRNNPQGNDGCPDEPAEEMTSLAHDFERVQRPIFSSLSVDSRHEDDADISQCQSTGQKFPMISAGMQYASFLSCIDFGAQIGDWITIPIVTSLDITRENHWNNLDKLVIICSIFRMVRVVFLWLICPPIYRKNRGNGTNNSC